MNLVLHHSALEPEHPEAPANIDMGERVETILRSEVAASEHTISGSGMGALVIGYGAANEIPSPDQDCQFRVAIYPQSSTRGPLMVAYRAVGPPVHTAEGLDEESLQEHLRRWLSTISDGPATPLGLAIYAAKLVETLEGVLRDHVSALETHLQQVTGNLEVAHRRIEALQREVWNLRDANAEPDAAPGKKTRIGAIALGITALLSPVGGLSGAIRSADINAEVQRELANRSVAESDHIGQVIDLADELADNCGVTVVPPAAPSSGGRAP